jgi:DNA polymerase
MATVHFDFETRSVADLRRVGVEKYAEHPSTEVLCLGYSFDREPPELWAPRLGQPFPKRLADAVLSGARFVAHNSAFDRVIWNVVLRRMLPDVPELKIEQTDCTMIRALALGLPGGLGQVCAALRLPVGKDTEGAKVMMRLCKPQRSGGQLVWNNDPALFDRLYTYCKNDIEAERPIDDILPPLSADELRYWHMSERINARGIRIDLESASRLSEIVEAEGKSLSLAVSKITKGAATPTQRAKLLEWLKANGLELENMRKHTVREALKVDQTDDIKEVLNLQNEANKTSTAKLKKMVARACADGRARGEYRFNGASTRRFSSTGIQLHNFARPEKGFKVRHAVDVFEYAKFPNARRLIRGQYGSVMNAVSNSLRPLLMADEGKRFICADYSNIEGRVCAWFAGEHWKLAAFRAYDTITGYDDKGEAIRAGADLYKMAFSKSFGRAIETVDDDNERQVGKVIELSAQFQSGIRGFLAMAANYGMEPGAVADVVRASVSASDWSKAAERYDGKGTDKCGLERREWTGIRILIDSWREANSAIRSFWYDMEQAAIAAVAEPGKITGVNGKVHFGVADNFLWMRLPSGGKLAYAYPELREIETPWGVKKQSVRVYGTDKGAFAPYHVYGGILVENCVQATARDIQVRAMDAAECNGYPVVMHTHDEIVAEVPATFGSLEEFSAIMADLPPWATDLPVTVAGWQGTRYRKA